MKKKLTSSLFVLLSLALVLVLQAFLPKYADRLKLFFIFLLLDGYLWFSIQRSLQTLRTGFRYSLAIIYWLPLTLLLCVTVFGFFVPFLDWNLPLRTYLQNFILILFLTKLFPILTLILADLARVFLFAVRYFSPDKKESFGSIIRAAVLLKSGWILGLLIFLIMTAGTIFWQFDFKIRTQEITLNELPASFNGFKIVQISDVHLGSWGSARKLQQAMDEINGLKPDVIFFTGDMFNYCTADGYGFEPVLKSLHAPFGIYAILGNHDYGDYIHWPSAEAKQQNMEDLKSFYKNLEWKLLLNSNDILKKGNDSIAVIGVENWGSTRRFQRSGDIKRAQSGTETMEIQLLLSHDPSHWETIISRKFPKIDLTFSGHTHGGQVGIDCCGLHWSPVKWLYDHWCGLYKNPLPGPVQYLYVNQGLGNIGYSGRIGIMPEITLITLKCR
jgi:predicted MPP superfamily phosphohydrolase